MTRDEIKLLLNNNPEAVCDLVIALQTNVVALQSKIDALEEQLATLTTRLNKDSHNSSKPPSTDPPRKKNRSLRKPSGKKTGGQPNHPGSTLAFSDKPDYIIPHDPQNCSGCGASLKDAKKAVVGRRQEFDIPPPALICTEHQIRAGICSVCDTYNAGVFPEGINAPVQYGPRTKSAVVSLAVQHLIPYNRTQEIISNLYGQAPSEGSIRTFIQAAFNALQGVEEEMKKAIIASPVVHFDETGARIDKKLRWFHVASTKTLTHYISHDKRGCDAINEMDILPNFTGVAVHDRWKPYSMYEDASHEYCCAHLLRDLCHIFETTKQTWCQRLSSVLVIAQKMKERAISENKTSLDKGELNRIKLLYMKIVRSGLQRNPIPERTGKRGRIKKSLALNMLEFLQGNLQNVLGFVMDFKIPFDNNQAERDVRMLKVKQKVSGCFRSEAGAREFCRIKGYLSTLRKQKLNIFDGLVSVFRGNPIRPSYAKNAPT